MKIKSAATTELACLTCHRALYGALFLTYGAGCLGLDKEVVNQAVAGLYFLLMARG